MKKKSIFLLLVLTVISCESDNEEKVINDKDGIIYELNFLDQTINLEGLEYSIGFRVSDPSEKVIFSGQDSLYLKDFYPDGLYSILVRLRWIKNYDSLDKALDFQVDVKAINNDQTFNFQDIFNIGDTVGTSKPVLEILKQGNSYKIER